MSVSEQHTYKTDDGKQQSITCRRVIRVIERTIDKKGQLLLDLEIELEGWWTSLEIADQKVIELYEQHGPSEQFHSELKTDMDLERLPSGKFATNALIMSCAALAYNILRFVGQLGLLGGENPGTASCQAKENRDRNPGTDLFCRKTDRDREAS